MPSLPIKSIVRTITLYPSAAHLHENCTGWDYIGDDYCCENCSIHPCHSWRCGDCLWTQKPILKKITKWAWS